MPRPFRFGVVSWGAYTRSQWQAFARKVEELGYATLLLADHVSMQSAPLTSLAMAAEVTTSLRVGSFVFCNDLRHPVLLAQEVATLDLLSEGRFELGLGPGYMPSDYHQTGIPFEKAGTRISRFEEALHIIKRCLTQEQVHFHGRYYTIADLEGGPKPIQQPYPPIYIGGGGKRMLSIAAREADIIGISPRNGAQGVDMSDATLEATTRKVEWVREAAGERFEHLELSCMVFQVVITDDQMPTGHPTRESFGPPGTGTAHSMPSSVHVLIGSVDQIVDELLARREAYGFSYIQVIEHQMEAFAPVVARLAGE